MEEDQERKISGLVVRIERNTCIASDNCTAVAPEVFELDDSNIVNFLEDAPDIDRDRLIEACAVCPVGALIAIDEDGIQLVP